MKKKLFLIITVVVTIFTVGCANNDDMLSQLENIDNFESVE